jgi:hypothetical protein
VVEGFDIAYPLRDEDWGPDASCFASRVARSSTSCPTVQAERLARQSRRERRLGPWTVFLRTKPEEDSDGRGPDSQVALFSALRSTSLLVRRRTP